MLILNPDNDNRLWLHELTESDFQEVQYSATITFALYDSADAAVVGASGSFTFVPSLGKFKGEIASSVSLTPGTGYYLRVTVVVDSTMNARVDVPTEIRVRRK